MSLKINPIVATIIIASILILIVALFKGCKQGKMEVAAKEKAIQLADSALSVIKEYKTITEASAKEFQDTIEYERGQSELIRAQKERTENELDAALAINKSLIEKHRLSEYTDTSSMTVPNEYVTDCESCYTQLDATTKLSLKYKDDFGKATANWNSQRKSYETRLIQMDTEKTNFLNKIGSLSAKQKEAAEKLKPHGRLYLTWGVVWKPWPWATGAGLMYQTKNNMMYGAKWYYGSSGQMIETTLNFPLSIKF